MADRGRGRGHRGGRAQRGGGRANGAGNTAAGRVCFEFQRTGSCSRTDCRFSHDMDDEQQPAGPEVRPTRVPETEEQRQARQSYYAWKRLLSSDTNNERTMRRLWEGALKIVGAGDRDWKQQLPQDLDSDDKHHKGRLHIDALMSKRVLNDEGNKILLSCRNFLLTITHPDLLNCMAVDTYVGSIYNYISGANGTRAMPFFQHLCEAITVARTANNPTIASDLLDDMLVAVATALRELLKRERRARFNEDLESLMDSLETAAKMISSDKPSITSMMVLNHMKSVRDMVARANGLLSKHASAPNGAPSPSEGVSFYPRDLVIPGDRHDNDKLDMTEIAIFPTRDEIMSDAKEFLPFTDPDQPHYLEDTMQRHIDTHFRLFRHDIFGELKPALAGLMHTFGQDRDATRKANVTVGDARAYSYQGAHVSQVVFGRMLEVQLSLMLPPEIRDKSQSQQRKWCEESRRLAQGCLLSFIWIENDVPQHMFMTLKQRVVKNESGDGLMALDGFTTISASLMRQDKSTLRMLMRPSMSNTVGVLLEFPKIMPATFVPILENLQSMQRLGGMPFQQWVVPTRHDGAPGVKIYHDIPPPLYARRAGFSFPLDSITNGSRESISIKSTDSCDDEDLLKELEAITTLDRGQCRALVAAFTREFAFIQGPPGTGKSYLGLFIMRILLAVKKKADLGPILVVCYTNHALDQFLEHLINVGVTKIIRVGGQSKSQILENHNLRKLKRTESNTRTEKSQAWQAYKTLDEAKRNANDLLDELRHIHRRVEWLHLKYHLLEDYSEIYYQFKRVDEEGWQLVGRHPFDLWSVTDIMGHTSKPATLHQQTATTIGDIIQRATANIWALNNLERRALIAHWIGEIHEAKVGELFEIVNDAATTQTNLDNVHAEASRRILQEADVIGLTTSGLAGRISLLKNVACKVITCEEAGEILEPHMLSALLPTVEHCIQIGDHEQLRPSVSNFDELSLESERGKLHQLDKSQFERLSVGEQLRPLVPVSQLNVQRRMRPEISTLIRETIYDKLSDHTSTTSLPDVVGLRKNVFWLDHNQLEDAKPVDVQNSKSKSNRWEVEMVHVMVRHLVRQGVYKSSDIAVLTPYTGQLQKLRAALREDFEIVLSDRDQEALEKDGFATDEMQVEGERAIAPEHARKPLEKRQLLNLLRVATVDNFQGEEAKVVIVSLVRSNTKRNVGFLKTSNRINVLLSRAQHGMYLIGNTDTYSAVAMWEQVISMLRASDSVGPSLGLCCPRHPETIMDIRELRDFAKLSPEGGCREPCADRLDCGHRCEARCHSEAMHTAFQCEQPCERRHQPCDHPCQKSTCGEPCGKCMIEVDNVQIPCGHVLNGVNCYMTLDLANIPCHVSVKKHVPGCEHDVMVNCSHDVTQPGFKCLTPCGASLICGHMCPGTCGRCNFKAANGKSVAKHLTCTKKCQKKLGACNHVCSRLCHDGTDCGLCQKPCEVRCNHSKCPHKCYESCAPCAGDCEWTCEHQGACTMPCSAPCDRLPCDERCTKALPCGHQCPSICGEDCPIHCCQDCGMRADELPDLLEMKPFSDLDLDETPIIALACGHFFTMELLDGIVGLKEVYEQDPKTGHFTSLSENTQLATKVPQCPSCRQPIRQHVTKRYNRLINKAVIDETSKRFIVSGQQELQKLDQKLKTLEGELETSQSSVVPMLNLSAMSPEALERTLAQLSTYLGEALEMRYVAVGAFERSCKDFQKKTDTQHEPTNKLHQAIAHANKKHHPIETDFAKLNMNSPAVGREHGGDQRIKHGGSLLHIKIKCLVLEDKAGILSILKSRYPVNTPSPTGLRGSLVVQFESILQECVKLFDDCIVAKLPKIAVEVTLYYARIVQALVSSGLTKHSDRDKVLGFRRDASELLEIAAKLCEQPFGGASALMTAVEQSLRVLGKEFYEEVTKEEIEAIKQAMVSGPGGVATHSGHWYNCVNGHPFAIGECGMPMEQARCPECGEPVGGRNHTAVAGVTRAVEMER